MKNWYKRNRKAVVAVVGAAIGFATLVVTSDTALPTSSEYLAGAVALLTALGVYGATNEAL